MDPPTDLCGRCTSSRRRVATYGQWPSSIGAGVVAVWSTSYDAMHTTRQAAPRFHVITATVLPARDQKRPHLSGTLLAHNADHITRSVLVIQALDNTWSLPNRRRRSSRYFDSAIRDGTVLSHEGHGLRRADNITHALEAELVFCRTGLCGHIRPGSLLPR